MIFAPHASRLMPYENRNDYLLYGKDMHTELLKTID